MIETNDVNYIIYPNSLATSFNIPFKARSVDDLRVVFIDENAVETVVGDGTFTVTGLPDDGVLTLPGGMGTTQLGIYRKTAVIQTVDIENQGGFFPSILENQLDRLTLVAQDQEQDLNRTIKVPFGSTGFELPFGSAGNILIFGEDGKLVDAGVSIGNFNNDAAAQAEAAAAAVINATIQPLVQTVNDTAVVVSADRTQTGQDVAATAASRADALTFRNAAEGFKNDAATLKGQADGAKTAAETAAGTSLAQSVAAAASAGLAQSVTVNAFPRDFSLGKEHIGSNVSGAPGVVTTTALPLQDDADGRRLRVVTSAAMNVPAKGVLAAIPGRIYKVTANVQLLADPGSGSPIALSRMIGLDGSFNSIGAADGVALALTAAAGKKDTTVYVAAAQDLSLVAQGITILAWPAGSVWLRPAARIANTAGPAITVDCWSITLQDATDDVARVRDLSQRYTKTEADAALAAAGAPLTPAALACPVNDTLSSLTTRDGYTPVAGDRVLVPFQTIPSQNGVWIAAAGAWTRAADADTQAKVNGKSILVLNGANYGSTTFALAMASGGTVGATALTATQTSGKQNITAGTGLQKSGNALALASDVKATLQLDLVNNTPDNLKPVSTAQQTAIAAKQDKLNGSSSQLLRADGSAVSPSPSLVGLNNVPNLAPADLGISTATAAALAGKQATIPIYGSTQTFRIGAAGGTAHFQGIQAAMDALAPLTRVLPKLRIILLIEAGYLNAFDGGVTVAYGDYGMFEIKSEGNRLVKLPASSWTGASCAQFNGLGIGSQSTDGRGRDSNNLILGHHARMPVLGCVIDMEKKGDNGYMGYRSAHGSVRYGCGVINAGHDGCNFSHASSVDAEQSIWNGANNHCIRISFGSHGDFQQAQACFGAQDPDGYNWSVVDVSRSSQLHARGIDARFAGRADNTPAKYRRFNADGTLNSEYNSGTDTGYNKSKYAATGPTTTAHAGVEDDVSGTVLGARRNTANAFGMRRASIACLQEADFSGACGDDRLASGRQNGIGAAIVQEASNCSFNGARMEGILAGIPLHARTMSVVEANGVRFVNSVNARTVRLNVGEIQLEGCRVGPTSSGAPDGRLITPSDVLTGNGSGTQVFSSFDQGSTFTQPRGYGAIYMGG